MRGHVARKGNHYYAVVYEGTDPATGRQRHRWYPGGSTRRDAERVLGELVKRLHDGDYRSPERNTLGAYLTERWLPLRRSLVRHSTWAAYRRTIDTHVIPYVGAIPLQRLTADDLDGALRHTPHEREAQRRRRRPVAEDSAEHPQHAAQGAR